MDKKIEIFCCSAPEDQSLLKQLEKHFRPLLRRDEITLWSNTTTSIGLNWKKERQKHLESADIILLLISPDFIDSDHHYHAEMERAIERHDQSGGSVRVIPILLRSIDWNDTPFAKFKALPTNALPVAQWKDQDEAFFHIISHVKQAMTDLQAKRQHQQDSSIISPDEKLNDVIESVVKTSSPVHDQNSSVAIANKQRSSRKSTFPASPPFTYAPPKRDSRQTKRGRVRVATYLSFFVLLGFSGFALVHFSPDIFSQKTSLTSTTVSHKKNSMPAIHKTPTPLISTEPTLPLPTPSSTLPPSTPTPSPTLPPATPSIPATWRQVSGVSPPTGEAGWAGDSSGTTDCTFLPDGYQEKATGSDYCNYGSGEKHNFSDLAYSINVTILQGNQAGLIFHKIGNNYYAFDISTDGTYIVTKHTDDGNGNGSDQILTPGTPFSTAIHQGQNMLEVIVINNSFQLWINNNPLPSISDDTYSGGTIATSVNASQTGQTVALFQDLKLWTP